MKRLRILFVLSLFLSIQSFCSWNQDNFNQLKNYLGGNEPFCVICVARSGLEPLNSLDVLFLQHIVEELMIGKLYLKSDQLVKKAFEIMDPTNLCDETIFNRYKKSDSIILKSTIENFIEQKIKEYAEAIIQINEQITESECDFQSNPGIIAFDEYFFGTEPIPEEIAKQMALNFSLPHKITACNFVTQSNGDSSEEAIEIENFISYQQELNETKNKRCDTCVQMNPSDGRRRKLENKTFFSCDQSILMTYKKSTYSREKAPNIEKLLTSVAYYSFGNWDAKLNVENLCDKPENILNLAPCLQENLSS